MLTRVLAILLALALLPACGNRNVATLESFKEQWYAAINQRRPDLLYNMLDAKSRRTIDVQLETLRGLPEADQMAVVNHLGGDRVANLHEISNERYFALWWRKATDDQLPTMTMEAAGERSAYMIVALKDQQQRFELKVEGGKWVWVLNEQKLGMPPVVGAKAAEAK